MTKINSNSVNNPLFLLDPRKHKNGSRPRSDGYFKISECETLNVDFLASGLSELRPTLRPTESELGPTELSISEDEVGSAS